MKISSFALAQVDPGNPTSPTFSKIVETNGQALQLYSDKSLLVSNAKFQIVTTSDEGNLRIFKQNQYIMCMIISKNSMITDSNLDTIFSGLFERMK